MIMTEEQLEVYNHSLYNLKLCKARVKALELIYLDEGNAFFTDELRIETSVFKGDNAKTILRLAKTLAESELDDAQKEFELL